jgi:hypothetical protein
VVAVVHPPDSRGRVCTGLDGFHRIPAAVRAGRDSIPAWITPLREPFRRSRSDRDGG